MMAASGCPLLSLFGPTSPKKFAPISPNFTVLQAQSFAPEGAVNTADMTHIPVSAVCDVIHSTLTQSDYMPS
jgi:ADP-heptose:LPS heptosyltransferase